jgi:hypothetical protein
MVTLRSLPLSPGILAVTVKPLPLPVAAGMLTEAAVALVSPSVRALMLTT